VGICTVPIARNHYFQGKNRRRNNEQAPETTGHLLVTKRPQAYRRVGESRTKSSSKTNSGDKGKKIAEGKRYREDRPSGGEEETNRELENLWDRLLGEEGETPRRPEAQQKKT